MTHYLLSVYPPAGQEGRLDEAGLREPFEGIDAFNERLQDSGAFVFAGGMHPATSATVVRERGGRVVTTHGPFLEVDRALDLVCNDAERRHLETRRASLAPATVPDSVPPVR